MRELGDERWSHNDIIAPGLSGLSVRAVLSGASCSRDEDLRTFPLISNCSLAFSLPLRSLMNSELEWDGNL